MKKQKTETPLATIILRIPRPLKAAINAAADTEETSTAELTRYILRRWYEERAYVAAAHADPPADPPEAVPR